MIKIYGDLTSGNCLKVKYCADFLELPYQWMPVNTVAQEPRQEDLLALNPAGQVPIIVLGDGRALSQSNAIIQYLAQDTPLLSEDSFARAKINEWLFWEQYSHEPYIAVCRSQMIYFGKSKDEREAWRVARGEQALELMNAALEKKEWLGAGHFTIADISLLAYTRVAHEGGFDLSARSNLQAWIARCEEILKLEAT